MSPDSSTTRPALYIHIPFCERKCPYCAFYSEPITKHDPQKLLDTMLQEIDMRITCQPKTIYLGGGSPTCLPENLLIDFVTTLTTRFSNFDEFTIEANPAQLNYDLLKQLHAAGVTRLSIGAQSLNNQQLNTLGRIHNVNDIFNAFENARKANFENINIDLIFAIPESTPNDWKSNLKKVCELKPEHISAYSLTFEENTPFWNDLQQNTLQKIPEDVDAQMYETTIDILEQHNYQQYEISNFAKPGFECQHNLTYWANAPYIGIGPAAASWHDGQRSTNIENITKYINAITANESAFHETQSPNDIQIACETAVLNLRRRKGIDLKEFHRRTNYDLLVLFSEEIEHFLRQNLLEKDEHSLRLTRKALPIANHIICEFADIS